MKFLVVLLLVCSILVTVYSTTEPVCAYRNSQDGTVFLKYLPIAKKGEEYVDFGRDGRCLKKATCSDTFKIELEECSKYPVTCANKARYSGVFPACCVKC